jgi:hypothetical protein
LEDAWQSELKYGSFAGEGHAYVSATLIGTVRGKKDGALIITVGKL